MAKRNRKSKVVHIHSEEDFDNQINNAGDKLVVVDFFATWCGPCNNIARHLDEFADKYESQVLILKVNVDELRNLAYKEFDVFAMPTFVFFKGQKIVERYSDANEVRMEETINRLLK